MVIETIQYRVNWRAFHKGASFFVPCIDWREARRKVLRITDRLRLQVALADVGATDEPYVSVANGAENGQEVSVALRGVGPLIEELIDGGRRH